MVGRWNIGVKMGEPANVAPGKKVICCDAAQRLEDCQRRLASVTAEWSFLKSVHEKMRALLAEEKIAGSESYEHFKVLTADNASTPNKLVGASEPDLDETFFDENPKAEERAGESKLDETFFDFEEKEEKQDHKNGGYKDRGLTSFDWAPQWTRAEELKYPHKEVLPRDKASRKRLPGQTCHDCDSFYQAAGYTGKEKKKMVNLCSKHRGHFKRSGSPEGFWDLKF